ncbi:MAG: DUF2634 domain-containing protein [Tenacibaculum sp.]|nr:DUF2634 domain-containing protein [Tenacibaculum sp.]
MGIFPFFEKEETIKTEKPIFKEYAYDFENNTFKTRNGREYLVYRDEALKIWIYKALKTFRFKHLAYDDAYGAELYRLIGKAKDIDIVKLEIKRYIKEALLVNPYILEVSNFRIFENIEQNEVSFEVKTVYFGFDFTQEMEFVNG